MATVVVAALVVVGMVVLFGAGCIVGMALALAASGRVDRVDHDASVYAEGYADGQAAR